MRFIAAIVVITLLDIAACNQDFGSHFFENTDPDHSQSDLNTYLTTINTQQSLQKSQSSQSESNSQQNDIKNYQVQQPSTILTPPKLNYSRQFFSPTSQKPFRSVFRSGRQLGGAIGGIKAVSIPAGYTGASVSPEERDNLYSPELRIFDKSLLAGPALASGFVSDDLNHPPHVHSIDVECSKTMMTINIEFNRVFDGIIYSKGYYTNPECIYVKPNSGLIQYSFTLNINSCGTQFINDFEGAAGQAYLENVLVLQNEVGIQEVWDAIRRVRCLWEGNINKTLTVNLSVDMLNQEIVTFSGDTATAKLDIQIGKGPFASAADGLVKIGETMTLVVSVEGDPGFDLQVRDCLARDEASTNMLQLTDKRGCILKPKLFGAFQKTKDTGNTGASIIAYAFFQAFKFPDVMDLFIECNVELCKTNCESCPEANQQIEPGRRRRSITYTPSLNNTTNSVLLSDPFRVGRHFKVILLDDLSTASNYILSNLEKRAIKTLTKTKEVCMSDKEFYIIFSLTLSILFIAIISVIMLYVKLQWIQKSKFVDF